ncbi:MAG: peptidoglycan-binding protein [Arenicella sp.]|nr:peptidoglycan-binding protein [Arenicella sp.]
MKLKPLSIAFALTSTLAVSSASVAQSGSELFPPNAEPGRCYARALVPAKYQDSTEQVLVSEASESIKVIPAKYQTSTETVLVREASSRIETTPATYKTVTEQIVDTPETIKLVAVPATYKEVTERVLVKPASTILKPIAAEYGTVTEEVLDKPAHTVWKRGSSFTNQSIQTSIDQSTGEIMCLVEVPASYKTIIRRVLLKPATTEVIELPAQYAIVKRTVIDTPATTQKVVVPATYKTVSRQVIDRPASSRVVEIPAEYAEVTVTKQVSEAQTVRTPIAAVYDTVPTRTKVADEQLVWREVLCDVNITRDVVVQLQTKLKEAGHYRFEIDGIWGKGTQRAINNFSDANGLPSGSNYIVMEAVRALGIGI